MSRASILATDRNSTENFMMSHRALLKGRVLDYAPTSGFKDLVVGSYELMGHGDPWPIGGFDVVICNQVLQYVVDPIGLLAQLRTALLVGGYLVLTYPTCWAEDEDTDLWRFTRNGMELMLKFAGFQLLVHERLSRLTLDDFELALTYGVVAAK